MLDYYRHPGLRDWVAARMGAADVHYIYSAAMAPYVLDAGPRGQAARVLDMQDIDSEKWAIYAKIARFPMRAVWAREARTLLAYERHAAMACDVTFFVSEPETIRFAELAPEAAERITWVENGVDLEGFSPARAFRVALCRPRGSRTSVIFTGNMDYWPNADAVVWFATEVLPLLRRRLARPNSIIVGANPGPEVRRLAELPGVTVTGRVPDVRPWLAHADVSVGPLRIARGIQNKVLEAMAMGRPVVASPGAFEGVRAVAGRDLLVADGAVAIAEAIGAVLDGAHPGLGAAGRAAVEAGYAWSATLARLDAALARVAERAA